MEDIHARSCLQREHSPKSRGVCPLWPSLFLFEHLGLTRLDYMVHITMAFQVATLNWSNTTILLNNLMCFDMSWSLVWNISINGPQLSFQLTQATEAATKALSLAIILVTIADASAWINLQTLSSALAVLRMPSQAPKSLDPLVSLSRRGHIWSQFSLTNINFLYPPSTHLLICLMLT